MASEASHTLIAYLHHLSSAARAEGLSDRVLVERFASQRDEDAFAALVRRHGPMVLRVCQRVLHDGPDAEDVFQAAFLVLSRKASSLSDAQAVGCFLHGVAYRLALKARTRRARQRLHESRAAGKHATDDPLAELSVREAQTMVDEELARLPEKYRAPLLLCCLQGRTRDEAARQLGWPVKLIKSRLEQGRERLRSRLSRRGLTVPAALAATLLAEEAAPAALIPATLLRATIQAVYAGSGNGIAPSVVLLAESALGGMASGKTKIAVGLLLLTAALAAGVGVVAPRQTALQTQMLAAAKPPETPKAERPQSARTDRYGDPLPPRALARLGTVRFRPGDPIRHIEFSPDGKLLAVATQNMEANANLVSVSLWDRTTGKRLRQFSTGKRPPYALAFAPNGKTLAALDEQGEIRLWDVETGKELRRIAAKGIAFETASPSQGGLILGSGLVFSPDGMAVAARGTDKAIHLWETATGKEVRKLSADQEDVAPLAFSRDGKMLTTSAKKMIRLWDVETGKEKARLLGHDDLAGTTAFSADGKTFTVLTRTPGQNWQVTAYVWDIAAAKLMHKWDLPPNPVFACALSPDGKQALAGAGGGHSGMRLFDLANGKEIRRLPGPSSTFFAAAFSPDGKTIAAAGENRALLLWDAATGEPEAAFVGHQGGVKSLAISPDDKFLASVASDEGILLWDLATGRPLPGFHSPKGFFNSVAISPDGQWLAAGIQWRKDVRLLKTLTGEEVRRFAGCENGENVLAFSPDGKILAAGSTDNVDHPRDKSIRLWEAATGKLLRRIVFPLPARPRGGIVCLAFSPDGRFLASGGGDKAVHIWNAVSGELYCRLPGHEDRVSSLCFSPDGQTLAVTDWEQTKKAIHLWEVRSGKERGQIVGHTDRGSSLAVSPDGRLASVGDDKTIRIWDPNTGTETECFRGHESVVGPLVFSSDGRRLISGGWDTTILVWDAKARPQPRSAPTAELSAKELETLWTTLADEDAAKAYQALGTMSAASRQSVPFLKTRLRPVPEIDAKILARLIADLDDAQFTVRDKASVELTKYGNRAETSLRKTLATKPALEVRRRIEAILEALNRPLSGEQLRPRRAVEVLEQIGTRPAQEVLQMLAAGAPGTRLTCEAKAALERLTRRSAIKP